MASRAEKILAAAKADEEGILAEMEKHEWVPAPGRIVQYKNRSGYVLPAVVLVTEETYVHGRYRKVSSPSGQIVASGSDIWSLAFGPTATTRTPRGDRDGQVWEPSEIPPVKPGRVHLKVFGIGKFYDEFNVARGDGPGQFQVNVF